MKPQDREKAYKAVDERRVAFQIWLHDELKGRVRDLEVRTSGVERLQALFTGTVTSLVCEKWQDPLARVCACLPLSWLGLGFHCDSHVCRARA
jgi:hypothetical protein